MENTLDLTNKYIAKTYNRAPVQLIRGAGSLAYDAAGNRYIDLGSGIAVNQFGIADPDWIQAVTAQLSCLQHTSNLYYSEPTARLAKILCERTGMERVFFSNSGAEANECAIKTARRRAYLTYGPIIFSVLLYFCTRGLPLIITTCTRPPPFYCRQKKHPANGSPNSARCAGTTVPDTPGRPLQYR